MKQKIFWLTLFSSLLYFSPDREEILIGILTLMTIVLLHEVVGVRIMEEMDNVRKQTKINLVKNQKLRGRSLEVNLKQNRETLAVLYPQIVAIEDRTKENEEEVLEEAGSVAQANLARKMNADVESILSQIQLGNDNLTRIIRGKIKKELSEALINHAEENESRTNRE